ncbi:MAG: ABC transporter substrate-binding protein [Chelatococcus sp.]|uniref:ABC transporter substrate-binding protein n=1 Tax=Chelatococcus sp. TaxID=1953771 RepID=UPI0025C4A3D6|nr:ABC transporter substrate-binding protein [Chelatococcus sp.]MBX3540357.1 ABC transporter substrate-binding protein [Chelatococcus sp.]
MKLLARLHRLSLLALAGTALLAVATPVEAQQKLRFGTSGALSNESIAVAVALDKGFYRDAGIEAEIVNFKGGAPAIQALVGKAIELCVCAPEHIIRLRNRRVDASVIVPLDNVTGYALFGPKDGPAKSVVDLKGKKIGITSPGSKTDNLVRLALSRSGANPDTDAQIIGIGGTANIRTALQTGNVEAGTISGFDALVAEKDFAVVHDWRTQKIPNLALLGLESWARENPQRTRALIEATLKAAKLSVEDRALRVATLTKLFPNATTDEIQLGADRLVRSTVVQPRFEEVEFERIQADVLELEPGSKPISYDTFNPDFLRGE